MLKVLACRGFTKRTVLSITGQPVVVSSPTGLVEYQGPGEVRGTEVMIRSTQVTERGTRKTFVRRIPKSFVLSVEELS